MAPPLGLRMPQPPGGRTTRHITRADSIVNESAPGTPEPSLTQDQGNQSNHVSAHYFLSPAYPSPFEGTLEASLDALVVFGRAYPSSMPIMDVLRQPVTRTTNWSELVFAAMDLEDKKTGQGRAVLEELFFLVTRTLLPEQIAQNRACMHRMYVVQKTASLRMMLRYDMTREWSKRNSNHYLVVESSPPAENLATTEPRGYDVAHPGRRALLPNVWSTLIAAPMNGWDTRKVEIAMKHHTTGLDKWLMYEDKEVAGWSTLKLVQMVIQVVLQWQWVRENTERMEDMEVGGWEDVKARADDCEWVQDEKKGKE